MADYCPFGDKSVSSRAANLARDDSHDPLGVALFLAASDLRELGLSLGGIDYVEYIVIDGRLAFDTMEELQ